MTSQHKSDAVTMGKGARPLADIVAQALAPACRRRGFATVDLIAHWPDIVGPVYAETTLPDRLAWVRKPAGVAEEGHEPSVLTIRCSGAVALRLNHELPQVIERINMFFGYRCVGRIKILQLPIPRLDKPKSRNSGRPSPEAEHRIKAAANGIGDEGLRAAVERLGRAVSVAVARPITKS